MQCPGFTHARPALCLPNPTEVKCVFLLQNCKRIMFSCFSLLSFFFSPLRQGISMEPGIAWNLLCGLRLQRSLYPGGAWATTPCFNVLKASFPVLQVVFLFLLMFNACVCSHVCRCGGVCVCVWACMWRPAVDIRVSHWNPELADWASQFALGTLSLTFQDWNYRWLHPHSALIQILGIWTHLFVEVLIT